jgi:putative PIN family toxin of toxin-antitoxin system
MKCLVDTNVLISAWMFPGSVPDKALRRSAEYPFKSTVCQYSIDEIFRVGRKKWPDKMEDMRAFIDDVLKSVDMVTSECGSSLSDEAFEIKDIDDAPILAAAIEEDVDMIITGDKDFFEGGYVIPFAISPANFANIDKRLIIEDIDWNC